jgi:hypothetical protein
MNYLSILLYFASVCFIRALLIVLCYICFYVLLFLFFTTELLAWHVNKQESYRIELLSWFKKLNIKHTEKCIKYKSDILPLKPEVNITNFKNSITTSKQFRVYITKTKRLILFWGIIRASVSDWYCKWSKMFEQTAEPLNVEQQLYAVNTVLSKVRTKTLVMTGKQHKVRNSSIYYKFFLPIRLIA